MTVKWDVGLKDKIDESGHAFLILAFPNENDILICNAEPSLNLAIKTIEYMNERRNHERRSD